MKAIVKVMLTVWVASAFLFTSCESDDSKVDNQNPEIVSVVPDQAAVGTSVLITGKNFSTTLSNNSVNFGSVSATITAATAVSLTVTVPAGATSGAITVKVGSKSTQSKIAFSVLDDKKPVIVSTSISSGFCGSEVTISGSNFSATPSDNIVKFNGTVATVLQASSTSLLARVPPLASTGNITVEVAGQVANGPSFQLPPAFTLTSIKDTQVGVLDQPNGIVMDSDGNFYITDFVYGQVNKITPAGIVSRVAGQNYIGNNSNLGTEDGPVATATLAFPNGLSFDKKTGDIYFLNSTNVKDNGALRKITPSGIVTTVAKGFYNPTGVVQDDAGNFYVADYGNFCVKKVTPSGTVSILAGSGSPTLAGALNATGTAARFTLINSIAIDAKGTIYVAEWGSLGIGSGSIRKITLAGEVSTYYTHPSTAFVEMFEVAVDAVGNVYASGEFTSGNKTSYFLHQITPTGNVKQMAFSTINSDGTYLADGCTIPFGRVAGITVDEKNRKLILLIDGIKQLNTIPM